MGNDYKKQLKFLIGSAEQAEWTVDRTGSGHYRFLNPDKSVAPVIAPSTASDTRSLANLKSQLKRAGLDL